MASTNNLLPQETNDVKEMHLSQSIENMYRELWENAPAEPAFIKERGFELRDISFLPNSLMFVGINPGYDEKNKDKENEDKEKTYKYYTDQENSAKKCGFENNFCSVDVFAIMHSKLNEIKDAINKKPGVKDFCIEQFIIFKSIVREINPFVIWVCSAYASDWMLNKKINKEAFDYEYDEELGTNFIINDSELKRTPIIISGMLGGRHPMDKGSREEHEWKIRYLKKVLK